MTMIKICGLFRQEDIEYVNEGMPDYIGFVFAESKRKITREQAEHFRKKLHPNVKAVGVFVKAPMDQVARLLNDRIIDMAQLHGGEDEDYIRELKNLAPFPVIKAVKVEFPSDINAALSTSADYLLLDHGAGGTGTSFNWKLIEDSLLPTSSIPFFLAGGLSLENIQEAINLVNPYAVDLSSGVETEGKKDKNKILEVVRRVRNDER
ncbi:phosphoribosylanthranilate isomerase [Sinanaerobacter chloroacetimidivorans]|uniref:N-(5'-phosphoribosyl)anthranilate isomerase n=1 Tax=Sinanaerobacter chloroacetimidivorans TaxID=2818044 RepID=A0A8J8B3P0_9FIRM|nr:phosphoribosylanthranilate isomerase [Sinanaerobacter chloroacetimidivorans]MBR0599981.1 phosphoribosylanthranilate isomerase [Sinanaerobacter chloroacetimidivorans]